MGLDTGDPSYRGGKNDPNNNEGEYPIYYTVPEDYGPDNSLWSLANELANGDSELRDAIIAETLDENGYATDKKLQAGDVLLVVIPIAPKEESDSNEVVEEDKKAEELDEVDDDKRIRSEPPSLPQLSGDENAEQLNEKFHAFEDKLQMYRKVNDDYDPLTWLKQKPEFSGMPENSTFTWMATVFEPSISGQIGGENGAIGGSLCIVIFENIDVPNSSRIRATYLSYLKDSISTPLSVGGSAELGGAFAEIPIFSSYRFIVESWEDEFNFQNVSFTAPIGLSVTHFSSPNMLWNGVTTGPAVGYSFFACPVSGIMGQSYYALLNWSVIK